MIGKIIGGLIGWASFQWIGAAVGIFIGHYFDRGRSQLAGRLSPEQRASVERAFFNTVFPLLGSIAKADGRVSEDEVSGTEQLMAKMGLSPEARQEAIRLFKQGAQPDFSPAECTQAFNQVGGAYADVKQVLLVYLITLAYADNHLHEAEERLLAEIAAQLGYSGFAFNHLMGMVKAQSYFYRNGDQQGAYSSDYSAGRDELSLAYEALGVEEGISDADLKRAYRKLMSENHPDKLSGRGVPEEMVRLATEKSQEIQTAYDLIRKHRRDAA